MRIKGAHALVTGGSQGLGVDLARELTRRGAQVTVVGRDEKRLQSVAKELDCGVVGLDLATVRLLPDVIAEIEAGHGPVDILINNAAVAPVGPVTEMDAGVAGHAIDVNLLAPIELTRQCLPLMSNRGRGHIVNVSSLAGVSAVPDIAVYGASKSALHHFTASLRQELAIRRCPVQATVVTLGEMAGTQMMQDARQSPVIAAVSARLARTRSLPALTTAQVARLVVDAIEGNDSFLTVPQRIAPLVGLRNLPTRIQSLTLRGISVP